MVCTNSWRSLFLLALLAAWQAPLAQAQPHPDISVASLDSAAQAQLENERGDSAPSPDVGKYSRDLPAEGDQNTKESAAPNASGQEPAGVEVIRERFADGSVHIEREVTQDLQGNFLNHGSWKEFDEDGKLVAQGQYKNGRRTGEWVRWYRTIPETGTLSRIPYRDAHLPLISQATFVDGELDGNWTIYDGRKQRLSEWAFREGKRHGASVWWYPNGRKMRDVEFREGDIDGKSMEWNPEGKATKQEIYQAGRKLAAKKSTFKDGKKKSQGMFLFAKEIERTPDDWWECKLQTISKQGRDERHGAWTSWFNDGQRQLEGQFEHDLQTGQFTWWHSNGQIALQGVYVAGKQDGAWTWWHPNGQKAIYGVFHHGNPSGRWTWWKEDGKLTQSADLSHSEGVVVETRPVRPDVPLEAKANRPADKTRR